MLKVVGTLALLAAVSASATAAPIFTDWTSVDFDANTAIGNLGGVSVSLSAGNIDYAIIDGTSPVFSFAHYTPALPLSDALEVQGRAVTPFANSVTFSAPVTDLIIHIGSLASVLTFTLPDNTPIPVIYVSGSIGATAILGNQVFGQLFNGGPADCQTDVCGTVKLQGTFTAFNFTSDYYTWPGIFAPIDGIAIQIGAESVTLQDGVPAPGALPLLALGLFGLLRRRAVA